jgi:hypothetical protein
MAVNLCLFVGMDNVSFFHDGWFKQKDNENSFHKIM